jgi:hypothetical protein
MSTDRSKHADPSSSILTRDIISRMPNDVTEILKYADIILPGWIVKESPQFSIDLFKFNEQWAFACAKMNIIPQKVLLVTEAYLDLQNTTHKIVREMCRRLTISGFVVMDTVNFDICKQCSEVIVSEMRVTQSGMAWCGLCQECTVPQ